MTRLTCNVVTLPRLCGAKKSAAELTARMPTMAGNDVAYLDAKAAASVARGYADEVVRQVLVEKNWGRLVVTGASPRLLDRLRSSAHRHGVATRLVVRT